VKVSSPGDIRVGDEPALAGSLLVIELKQLHGKAI
jgi:hypothetical protein